MKRIGLAIPEDLYNKLDEYSKENQRSKSSSARYLISKMLIGGENEHN